MMNTTKYEPLEEFDMDEFISDKDILINEENVPSRKESIPLRTQQSIKHETICGFDGLRVIVISSVAVSLALTIALIITILVGNPQVPPHGAIATDNKDCSNVGVAILKKGGSAVDAAIAAVLCIGVVNAHSAGIGGGGFMLVLDAEAAAYSGFDFRETAPAGTTLDKYAGKDVASLESGLTVGVPGELHGMRRAWEQFGILSWEELFVPAIHLARDGFKVKTSLANVVEGIDPMLMSRNLQNIYAPQESGKVKEGDVIKRPEYAKLLDRIATHGIQEFYSGDVAQEMVDMIFDHGGNLTVADLQGYASKPMTPITTTYRDYNLVSLPTPSGGPIVLTMLNIMELFKVTPKDKNTSLYYHRFLEALKFVKAQEIGLGESQIANYSQVMMSKDNAKLLYANITDDITHPPDYYFTYAQSILKTKGTSHISVIDKNNNMVSVTSTINTEFGSLLMTPSGIILNDEMTDFDWPGKTNVSSLSTANYIMPGKRPQSHMPPLMGRNSTTACARRFATGGEGGSYITSGVVHVVMELLAFKSSLYNATQQLNRVTTPLLPNIVDVEEDISDKIVADLTAKDHVIQRELAAHVLVNTVMKENDIMYAESDQRRGGAAASQY